MSFSTKGKLTATAVVLAGIGAAAFVPGAVAALNDSSDHPARNDNSCGQVNFVGMETYDDSVVAKYHLVACETDQLGITNMTDGEFAVSLPTIQNEYVIAALGQDETNRIKEILTELNQHLEHFPAKNAIYMHGMNCKPSVKLKGFQEWGDTKKVVLETRAPFSEPMTLSFGCAIQERVILDNDHLDAVYGEQIAEQVRQIQTLINQPMVLEPSM